jgi:DNA-binding response OmpR family regulator
MPPVAMLRRSPYSAGVRLLLVEDDVVIARELLLRWGSRGWTAQARASLGAAEEALTGKAENPRYDLIVLDLGLPDGDGVDWLTRWRRDDRRIPVIMLTARDRIADRVRGLQSGADDYLVKPFDPDELDARIEAVQRRGQVSRGERLQYGPITWLGDQGLAFVDGRPLELMPREFEVLGLLLGRAPRLLPKRWLIDALAERNLNLADSAAEVYVSRLRRKLAGSNATIRTLRGFGYVLEVGVDKDA